MRVLVTGGAGFIGSNFIRHILKKHTGHSVVNLDKLTYSGNPDNLRDVEGDKRYSFMRGDIIRREDVEKAGDIDCIVNFAAESHVDRSIGSPQDFINTNIRGVSVLLEYARERRIRRFVQVSTDEVYGPIKYGSFSEESALVPSNPYSASKASADLLSIAYFKTYRLPVVITRSTNNFGPHQYPEKLIPLFVTNALCDMKLPLYGNGMNIRDWIYVEDNCAAIDTVLHKGKEGEIYNAGSGNERQNLDIARQILKELGKDRELIKFVKDRPGHDWRCSVDSGKLRALEWKPSRVFEDALVETVRWYVKNRQWWEKIRRPGGRFTRYYKKHYAE